MQTILDNQFYVAIFLTAALIASAWAALAVIRPRLRRGLSGEQAGLVFLAEDGQIVDETPAGRMVLELNGPGAWDWAAFHQAFKLRFSGLPTSFKTAADETPLQISSTVPGDSSRLDLTSFGSRLRVELKQANNDRCIAMHHIALMDQITLSNMTRAISSSPYPIWVCDEEGRETWQSPEYTRLKAKFLKDEDGAPPLFQVDVARLRKTGTQRFMLRDNSEMGERWFEVSMGEDEGIQTFFAINITALVRAERAQRGFVQTLTKTFAQLGTGLAIFDRDRQLVLFNPALIDLTDMSAEFLSSRPTLTSFFDWLRENRVMPEPRDYPEWRSKLKDLTNAAVEGTFSELWSLPNGLSYRVFGRPHPDGAIAFLFEDVTAELSLTRNFITELEINHSLLDTLPQAIAIFSPNGDILSANRSYQDIWGEDPSALVRPVGIIATVEKWRDNSEASDQWSAIQNALSRPALSGGASGQITTHSGDRLDFRVTPLAKGASAIIFEQAKSKDAPAKEAEMLV